MATDTETAEEILEALRAAPDVDATEVSVIVEPGLVLIKGRVASHEEADAAGLVVESSVDAAVVNDLIVDPGLHSDLAEG